jgi:GNAT superfamily N-acetyltransferase
MFVSERLKGSNQGAVTYVWHRGDGIALASFTLSPHQLCVDHRALPAVLLSQLTLDESLQRQALGGQLLADALSRVLRATETVGASYVVAEPGDDRTAAVYQHHGFMPIPGTRRLVQRTVDIAAAIG